MSDDFAERLEAFDKITFEAERLLSIARDSELQRSALNDLQEFGNILGHCKQEAVSGGNEDRANLILGMECTLAAMRAELEVWLLLKAERPDDAWDKLIDAQMKTAHAIRAHVRFAHLSQHAQYLEAIEKLVFPSQVFLSSGLVVGSCICTICQTEYDGCPHVVGRPYWGQFCFRQLRDVKANHVAIVSDPANKRCRVTHFEAEGGRRNRMTWKIEASQKGEGAETEQGLRADCRLLSLDDLVS